MGFGRAITAEQTIIKTALLPHRAVGGDIKRIQQINLPVGAQLEASGICDPFTITGLPRFSSMKESADAGKRHRVGAMQNNKTVILHRARLIFRSDMPPAFRRHIR